MADSIFVQRGLNTSVAPDSIAVLRARGDAVIVQADSLLQTGLTEVLRDAAVDSVHELDSCAKLWPQGKLKKPSDVISEGFFSAV